MTLHSTGASNSIFEGGKLKPGIYKIQNIQTENYVDIEVHTRELCCRPARDLGEGRGLWEIKRFGAGYTLQFVEPGKPEQFCTTMIGGTPPVVVSPCPVAWRVEVADEEKHRGFEYIRFCWITPDWTWTLVNASKDNGAKIVMVIDKERMSHRIWKLIPVKTEGASAISQSPPETLAPPGVPPSYDGGDATGQYSARTHQVADSERDDFGIVVTEVTTVTTTTRKRYRVEDA